ncbi:MAG: phytanoyl-CoA dioxygenase family protein [Armatimonadetes bacterium]|nr:phytanoyl-CoA dioxygenase family protein [Armatimonadota bacterium]
MPQTARGRLTSQQVSDYHAHGYLLCHDQVFGPDRLARLQAIFEENLALYGHYDLDIMHARDPRLMEFLLADEVLDLVEPVIGPDIGLWSSHFISKPPEGGKATPWHEDSAYWQGTIDDCAGICTVWLAIDDTDRENGCMKVIPGTHRDGGGYSTYQPVDASRNIFGTEVTPGTFDESQAVYFELRAGECSLHEARIIHGADANTSGRRRAGYTMRYFPTTSRVNPERTQPNRIWQARGRDAAGQGLARWEG